MIALFVLLFGLFAIFYGPSFMAWAEARIHRAEAQRDERATQVAILREVIAGARGHIMSAALILKNAEELNEHEIDVLYEQVLNAYVTLGGTEADYVAAEHNLRRAAVGGREASSA